MIIQKLCIPFCHQEHNEAIQQHIVVEEHVIQGLLTRGPYSNHTSKKEQEQKKMERNKIK